MEFHNRMIQLLLPNQKLININLSGDEKELKDLISEIAGVSPSQIKGIKDSNHNYYTISSALKNDDVLKQKDVYYELILGKEKLKDSFSQKSHDFSQNSNNRIILNTTPNVGNYIANYYINGFRKNNINTQEKIPYLSKSFNKNSYQALKENENEIFNNYLFQLLSNNKINLEQYSELIKLIKEKNKDLIEQFKNKFSGKLDNTNFISILLKFTGNNKTNQITQIPNTAPLIKPKIEERVKINTQIIDFESKVKIYEKMKDYFNEDDIDIIRISLKYENESIMKAVKNYLNNGTLSSLILAFKKAVARYKKKSLLLGEKGEQFFSTRKIDLEEQNKSEDNNKNKVKRFKSSNKNRYLNKEQRHSMDDNKAKLYKAFSQSNAGQNNQNKSSVRKIKKLLKKNNKSIFEYIVKYFPEEYNSIEHFYENNIDNVNLADFINEKCDNFLDKEIINYSKSNGNLNILKSELEYFHKLSDENNNEVQFLFNEFEIQLNFSDFIKQVCEFIIHLKEKKENEIIESFIKDLQKIKMPENDYLKIKQMIEKKSSKIFSIINKYRENSDINIYIKEINTILKNKKRKKNEKKNLREIKPENDKHYLEEVFNELKDQFSFTFDQIMFLQNNYKKDEKLQKIFSNYFHKKNPIECTKIELENYIKSNNKNILNIIPLKQNLSVTPEGIKRSKMELNCFLRDPEDNKIILKQKEIISLLYKEDCLDEETYEIINQKIYQDDHALIAAFEVYAVTQDHIEFIETLRTISELFLNHKESFYIILNHSSFNSYQKEQLENMFRDKNTKIIQALELYNINRDKNLVFDTFNNLISSNE